MPSTGQDWLAWACVRAGGQTALARSIGANQQTLKTWMTHTKKGVPAEYCQAIEDATGVPKCKLRPDIYPEYTSITTEDGTVIVRDSVTGRTASGRTLEEALADLRRMDTREAA
nr:YdaS family helix-turn-helix protein [Mesorhizobium sp.]